jgi:hypothetical protein
LPSVVQADERIAVEADDLRRSGGQDQGRPTVAAGIRGRLLDPDALHVQAQRVAWLDGSVKSAVPVTERFPTVFHLAEEV